MIPSETNLPLPTEYGPENLDKYFVDLIFQLQSNYEMIAENVNGFIRNYGETDQAVWTPTLSGTGGGSFTYTTQYGWSVRQGLYTHIFFDVSWSGSTASGNLYLNLPYQVLITDGMPFVGTIQASNIDFGAGYTYLVINAISDTFRGEIWKCGSGVATANLAVPSSGRLIGTIKYIGVSND